MIRNPAVLWILGCVLLAIPILGQAGPGIEVTFLANEGFLLTAEEGSVLIDAFVAEPYSIYGPLPAAVQGQMERGEAPFEAVQLALVSHQHRDHFQPEAAVAFLRQHPETLFVSSPEVVDALLQEAGTDREATASDLKARVRKTWPAAGTVETITRGEIEVELFRLTHGGRRFQEIQNLGHVIHLGGRRILHIGDAATAPATFAAFDLAEKNLDVALLPSWFFSSPEGRQSLESHLRARHRVACHIPPKALAETRRTLTESDPEVVIFEKALESRRF